MEQASMTAAASSGEPARWKYCRTFAFLGLSMAAAGISMLQVWPVVSVLLFYAAVSFITISVLYRSGASNPFSKSSFGKLAVSSWLLNGPYLLLSVLCFRGYCLIARGAASVKVSHNVVFGRSLTEREARCAVRAEGWLSVLDVAAELSETRTLRELSGYKSFPLMDATAPTVAQLEEALTWIEQAVTTGPTYIHCAFGHGRSACVVVAHLLSIGEVQTVAEGELKLRALRGGVRLTREQHDVLKPLERRSVLDLENAMPVA